MCKVSYDRPIWTGWDGLRYSLVRFGIALKVSNRRENSGRVDGSFDQHFNKII